MTRDEVYLKHIAECIHNIESYVSGGEGVFLGSRLVQDAVIRNVEIIGEAVKRLSPEFLSARPQIPWKGIAGFRDVLIHNYFGVDLKQVWRVITDEMPALKQAVENP